MSQLTAASSCRTCMHLFHLYLSGAAGSAGPAEISGNAAGCTVAPTGTHRPSLCNRPLRSAGFPRPCLPQLAARAPGLDPGMAFCLTHPQFATQANTISLYHIQTHTRLSIQSITVISHYEYFPWNPFHKITCVRPSVFLKFTCGSKSPHSKCYARHATSSGCRRYVISCQVQCATLMSQIVLRVGCLCGGKNNQVKALADNLGIK